MSPLGTLKFQVTPNCPPMEKKGCSLGQPVSFFIDILNQLLNIILNFLSLLIAGKETLADEKWSDTLGTDTDQLNQSFVKTTNTDSTRKQVATYPAGFIKSSGDITCLYKYSYSGKVRTYSHTFQVKVESEFQ